MSVSDAAPRTVKNSAPKTEEEEIQELLDVVPGQRRTPPSRWQLNPATCGITSATVLVIAWFVFLSMSRKPFSIDSEVGGRWSAVPLDAPSKKKLGNLVVETEITVQCHGVDRPSKWGSDALAGVVSMVLGPFSLPEAVVAFKNVRPLTNMYVWHGPCLLSGHDNEIAACAFTFHKRNLLFTVLGSRQTDPRSSPIYRYLLRRPEAQGNVSGSQSWWELWETKGQYMVAMVIVIVVLTLLQHALDPTGRMSRMEARRRMLIARRAAKLRERNDPSAVGPHG